MTEAELQDIYRTGYWDAVGAEILPAGVDLSAFDYAVNSGPREAKKSLAAAMVAKPPIATIIDRIAAERLSFLHGLKTWRAFGKGWGPRVARIEAASLKMAGLPITVAANSAKAQQKASSSKAKAGAIVAVSALPRSRSPGHPTHGSALSFSACSPSRPRSPPSMPGDRASVPPR